MRRLALCLLPLLLVGCPGYHTRFDVPAHLHTFNVGIFINRTLEANTDYEFTQQLIHEIAARTPLRLTSEGEADLAIKGEIAKFDRYTLRRRQHGEKSEMQYVLHVDVTMIDRKKDVVFFEGKSINWRSEFRMNLGETQTQAREEVIRELARHVVDLAFERWPTAPAEPKAASQK
jgi:hypothetical protein